MDRIGADFFYSINDVKEKFGAETVACQIPIGQGEKFEGLIDLLTMKEIRWNEVDVAKPLPNPTFHRSAQKKQKNGATSSLILLLQTTMTLE